MLTGENLTTACVFNFCPRHCQFPRNHSVHIGATTIQEYSLGQFKIPSNRTKMVFTFEDGSRKLTCDYRRYMNDRMMVWRESHKIDTLRISIYTKFNSYRRLRNRNDVQCSLRLLFYNTKKIAESRGMMDLEEQLSAFRSSIQMVVLYGK